MMQKHHDIAPNCFQRALLAWYDLSRRELPWRAAHGAIADPYRVWLSEIMLQQTTVKAVIPYFQRFVARWPNVEALAAAPRDEVLAAWAGLGYYSRARNLHACARVLAAGGFPQEEAALRKLPGIGAYTAAAIAAIAFGEPAAVVDGNVERVLSRLFAVATPLPTAKPIIRDLAERLTPNARPGDYAQAMMDLGATLCTPRSPSCLVCPVRAFCAGAASGNAAIYPLKRGKGERPRRTGQAAVIVRDSGSGFEVLLRRRPDKGLLGGMMEVPCTAWVTASDGKAHEAIGLPNRSPSLAWREAASVEHTFTHFHLTLSVAALRSMKDCAIIAQWDGEWAPLHELDRYALPAVMRKALFSGLKTLNIQIASGSGKVAKSASRVSTVDRSARPSTRAGLK